MGKLRVMAIPSVKAVLILDCSDGSRVHAKYYSNDLRKKSAAQTMIERHLFSKTHCSNARMNSEVILFENTVAVYRTGIDVHFYVVGDSLENELILCSVLSGLFDAINGLLRGQLEKRVLLDNLDLVLLTVDELVDGGIILETDALLVANRVLMRAPGGDAPTTELTLSQALSTAKKQLVKGFRS